MHKKFKINWTKIKSGCQSGSKVVSQDSKSDLPVDSGKKVRGEMRKLSCRHCISSVNFP